MYCRILFKYNPYLSWHLRYIVRFQFYRRNTNEYIIKHYFFLFKYYLKNQA